MSWRPLALLCSLPDRAIIRMKRTEPRHMLQAPEFVTGCCASLYLLFWHVPVHCSETGRSVSCAALIYLAHQVNRCTYMCHTPLLVRGIAPIMVRAFADAGACEAMHPDAPAAQLSRTVRHTSRHQCSRHLGRVRDRHLVAEHLSTTVQAQALAVMHEGPHSTQWCTSERASCADATFNLAPACFHCAKVAVPVTSCPDRDKSVPRDGRRL
jgi:hypothetical protein